MKRFSVLLFVFLFFEGFAQLNTDKAILAGRSKLYFGNYTNAIQTFNMVIKLKPYLPEPYYYRGIAKLELDDFRGAKKDLDMAIEIKPFFPEAIMYRGVVHYNLKEFNLALEDYSKAMELDGENADIFNNRGICKAAMRDYQGAIEDYTQAVKLKSKNFNAFLNRSIAYQLLKEWDKAISDCNQLIRIKPNNPMGYMSRGLIKLEKEDYAGALRDFDMSIYFDSKNSFAYLNRGMIKQQLESYESAIMDYDEAIKLDPQLASAYFNRGLAKEMTGKPGYQSDYDRASLLDPRFAKRPWQTTEEKIKFQQQQMLAWQQKAQKQQSKITGIVEETELNDTTTNSEEEKIDIEELRKRKLKADLVLEESRKDQSLAKSDPGKVQDINIDIRLLPLFEIININKKRAENDDVGYFNILVENLNAAYNYEPYLTISNNINESSSSIEFYQKQISLFDEKIKTNDKNSTNYLYRGIFKALINDFNNSITDFDKSIKNDERNLLAYFMRANTKARMVEQIEKVKAVNEVGELVNQPTTSQSTQKNGGLYSSTYDDILTDYSVVVYMNPNFYFAYFNRGNIYCRNEKYISAIEEYDKAIALEPEFAEAYYNRGLVKILLNKVEDGAKDLSKSGELGIEEAYNVIKRYCN